MIKSRDASARYTARPLDPPLPMTSEMRDFLVRRTMPFLDGVGMQRSITDLLQEAYLQGMRDTLDALGPPAESGGR